MLLAQILTNVNSGSGVLGEASTKVVSIICVLGIFYLHEIKEQAFSACIKVRTAQSSKG
jgi:hypothetical protein